MKSIIRYMLGMLSAVSILVSCEDWKFLEEHPKKIDVTTFMSNAEEVESMINSIYYQLRRQPAFGRYLNVLSESLSDYCYGRGNYATSYETGLTSGAVTFTKDTWAVLYRAIRFANEILSGIDNADISETDYRHLSGEVRYLRAFSYSFIVKYFGDAPLFTEDNMGDFNKPRTPSDQLWNFVVSEADYAAKNLPEQVSQAGRPSRYAAFMLKGEALMYLQNYTEAAKAFREVITSNRFSLVRVSSADDFNKLYGSTANATSEEIFYFKFNRDNGATFPWMYLCKPNPVFDTGALGIYTDYQNNKFIANWDKNDLRYQWSLYIQTANGALNSLTSTGMICLKYRDYETNGSTMANDWPVYRYADALLYLAEAIARRDNGVSQEAIEYVNMVRRRAYGLDPTAVSDKDYKASDYSSLDEFIDLILQERGYETCFEGKRFCDLKRCGKLAEYAVKAGKINSESSVGDAAYWWPIPSDEFTYNTALDPSEDQNPGY